MHIEGDDPTPTTADIENTTDETEIEDAPGQEAETLSDENQDDTDADSAKKEMDEADEEPWAVNLTDEEDLEDDDPDDDDADDKPKSKDSKAIREMRQTIKRLERKNRKLAAKTKAADPANELPELGEKPTLEDFDYDQDKFEPALLEYHEKKRAHDAAAKKQQDEQKAWDDAHNERIAKFEARKAEIAEARPDFIDAEDIVLSTFSLKKQAAFFTVADDPAVLMLALSKSPTRLERLNAIKDPVFFIKEVVKLEGSLKVSDRTSSKKQPEKRVRTGTAPTNGVSDTTLKQLQAEADKTGDVSKLLAYRRKMAKQK